MIGFGDRDLMDFFDFADFIYSDGNVEVHKEIIECECRIVEDKETLLLEDTNKNNKEEK